jgi:hypothetical protein
MIFGKSKSTETRDKSLGATAPEMTAGSAPAPSNPTATKDNPSNAAAPEQLVPSAAATAASTERQAATIRYLDRADIVETFVDSVTGLIFDGQTLRIEFGVTRFDEVKTNAPITGRRYPACRLVMPPAAAVDLINRVQQIGAALTQAGVVKAAPRPTETP